MAGLVGYIAAESNPVTNGPQLIAGMRRAISYTGEELSDTWHHGGYAVSRVHHGILSPAPQPLIGGENNATAVVLDGEVFGSHCGADVEHCLQLYAEIGTAAFVQLDGSFLLAIYHLESRELLLVNDRFSSRPLFYYHDEERVIFGSQLRALLKAPHVPRVLDVQAVQEFLTFERILGDRTYFRDVKVLPPATILRVRGGKVSYERYWAMQYRPTVGDADSFGEALASTLHRAVSRRAGGPHRLGLLLSAGLDSRSILAALEDPPMTFTVGSMRNKEVQIAAAAAAVRGCDHRYLERNADHYGRILEEAVDIGDGMHAFFHAHFLGLLPGIKREADVVLHGHGLDYTFQGMYLPPRMLRMLGQTLAMPWLDDVPRAELAERLYRDVNFAIRFEGVAGLFRSTTPAELRTRMTASINDVLDAVPTGGDVHNAWDYFVLHSIFKHFTYLNVTSVRAWVDERTLIFDNELFDLYLAMPPALRVGGTVLRRALRRLSPELASLPNPKTGVRMDHPFSSRLEWLSTVTGLAKRKLRLAGKRPGRPSYVTDGSWPDMNELIRSDESLQRLIRETIHDEECLDPEVFDVAIIDGHLDRHLAGSNVNELLLSVLTFGRWHKKYGPTKREDV